MRWLFESWHKIVIVLTQLTIVIVHWDEILEKLVNAYRRLFGVKEFIERRHAMFKYLKLIPVLEKLAADLEADLATPQNQAVAADIRELMADIGSAPSPEPKG